MEAEVINLKVDGETLPFKIPFNTLKRRKTEPHFMILQQRGYVAKDWPWRLTVQLEILRKFVGKADVFCDLMVGMGVMTKLAIREISPSRILLNDLDVVCYLNAKDNFPSAEVFQGDANTFDHPSADLVTADFNTFTVNHLNEWDGLFKRLDNSKYFMFLDSAIYGFRFSTVDLNLKAHSYYMSLSDSLRNLYGFGVRAVGYPPFKRPNVAVVLAQAGYHGSIEYVIPKESIKLTVEKGLGLNV